LAVVRQLGVLGFARNVQFCQGPGAMILDTPNTMCVLVFGRVLLDLTREKTVNPEC
jgi:hypothetical protein